MPAQIEEITPVTQSLAELQKPQGQEVEQEPEGEPQAIDSEGGTEGEPAGEGEPAAQETVVAIGDSEPEEDGGKSAPAWVRELRQKNRELARENRELRERTQGASHVQALGPRPALADPDIDFDEDKFETRMAAWMSRKAAVDAAEQRAAQEAARAQAAFQERLTAYESGKVALKAPNIADAEDTVKEAFNEKQQAILIKCAKNPALMVLALGSNPGKLKELAGMTDLADFTYALASVEAQLKVTKKTTTPPPERRVQGDASISGANENTLEKLRAEAERTGDMSKVMEYKRKQRAA